MNNLRFNAQVTCYDVHMNKKPEQEKRDRNVNVMVTEATDEALRLMAARNRVTLSTMVNTLIVDAIKKQEQS